MRCEPLEVTYRVRTSAWVPVSILFLGMASTFHGLSNLHFIRRVEALIELQGKQLKEEFRFDSATLSEIDIAAPAPPPSTRD